MDEDYEDDGYDLDEDDETNEAVSEGELVDALLQLTFDNPIPDDLRSRIADAIEPYTMHCGLDHDDVMTCIEIAWVYVRDFKEEEFQEYLIQSNDE